MQNTNGILKAILLIYPTAYADYWLSDSGEVEHWVHAGPGELVGETHPTFDAAVAAFGKKLVPGLSAQAEAMAKALACLQGAG
jgi:hypothetical protein